MTKPIRVDAAANQSCERPRTGMTYDACARSGFPTPWCFVELPRAIRVVAFMHERRRPGYWKARIK